MAIWMALILGLVQGITEFLPVSSSGHLILLQSIFNLPDDLMLFNILLHVATLLAVVIVFRRRIWELVKNPFQPTVYALILATAITVAFVLVFGDLLERTFTARVLPVTFMLTAILLVLISFSSEPVIPGTMFLNPRPLKVGIATGLAQGLAVIPGFSRSGFTISAALASGVNRERAAEFAFLMSIPIIIAALVYEIAGAGGSVSVGVGAVPLIIAFIAALLSGIFAIKFMLKIVRNIKLYWFSAYLVLIAILSIFLI